MSETKKQATVELLGHRRFKVYTMREAGATYREIGREMGVTAGRARDIRKHAEYLLACEPHWTDGLETRTAHAIQNCGFKNKAEVAGALESGKLRRYRNIGRKAISDVEKWLGVSENEWHAGLSNRAARILTGMNITSREQALREYNSLMLMPGGPVGFGAKTHKEVERWLGINHEQPETAAATRTAQLERELNAANERIKRMAAIGSRFVNANDLTEYIATEHAWIEEVKNIPA